VKNSWGIKYMILQSTNLYSITYVMTPVVVCCCCFKPCDHLALTFVYVHAWCNILLCLRKISSVVIILTGSTADQIIVRHNHAVVVIFTKVDEAACYNCTLLPPQLSMYCHLLNWLNTKTNNYKEIIQFLCAYSGHCKTSIQYSIQKNTKQNLMAS